MSKYACIQATDLIILKVQGGYYIALNLRNSVNQDKFPLKLYQICVG